MASASLQKQILGFYAISSEEDFVTVTLSVRVAVVPLSLRPRNSATNNKMKTPAPITQTHGEAYQSFD